MDIIIDGVSQGERRRLTAWDFLRKDAPSELSKDLLINGTISNGLFPLKIFGGLELKTEEKNNVAVGPNNLLVVNKLNAPTATSAVNLENDIGNKVTLVLTSSNSSFPSGPNSGGLGYVGDNGFYFTISSTKSRGWTWRYVDLSNYPNLSSKYFMNLNPNGNITFSIITKKSLFVVPIEHPDFATWNSQSMMIGGDLAPALVNSGKDVNETRVVCSNQGFTKIDCDVNLTGADLGVQDDLEVKDTGFFSFLGSLTARITKLFVHDIDALGNINASNYTLNGKTITDWNEISSATLPNLTNYALKNQSETFAGNITTTQTGFFGYVGSLTSRITKLFVQDIDASNDIVIGRNLEVAENTTLKNDLFVKNNAVIQGDLEAGKGKLKLSTADDRVTITDVLRLKPRPKAPDNASLGDIYVDTTSKELCFFDGQNWIGVAKNETCS